MPTREEFTFTRAAAYYAKKLNLPSEAWTDLWKEQHERAFTVAGTLSESGNKALDKLREAVRVAMDEGESLEDFKKRFDDIAASTGWDYRGGRNFRARAIYQTNLRTARQAGRFEQLQEAKDACPFWQYRHGGSVVPRPEHLAWDGLILHADHPFWKTHFPPNGYGCTCRVVALDEAGVERQWKRAGGRGAPPKLTAASGGIVFERGEGGARLSPRVWTPPDPEEDVVRVRVRGRGMVTVPRGIDPGWDFAPGKAALEEQRKEEEARRRKAEEDRQKRAALYAELDAAHVEAIAELSRIELEAIARVKALEVDEAIKANALAEIATLTSAAIIEADEALANARKDAEKVEFAEGDESRRRLVESLGRITKDTREKLDRIYVIGRTRRVGRTTAIENVEIKLRPAQEGEDRMAAKLRALSPKKSKVSPAHVIESFDEKPAWKNRGITSITSRAILNAFRAELAEGRTTSLIGDDGKEYIEAVIGGKTLLVRAEEWRQGRKVNPDRVHWYPVGGTAVVVLNEFELSGLAAIKQTGQILNETEIREILRFLPGGRTADIDGAIRKLLAVQELTSTRSVGR